MATADALPSQMTYKVPIPEEGIAGLSDETKAMIGNQPQPDQSSDSGSGYIAPPNRTAAPQATATSVVSPSTPSTPSAELEKSQETEYVAPPNRELKSDQTTGYIAPPNRQQDVSTPAVTGVPSYPTIAQDQQDPNFEKILQVNPKSKEDVYAAHASGQLNDDQAMTALKGIQGAEQAMTIPEKASELAQYPGRALEGVKEGVAAIPQLVGNVQQFAKSKETADQSPASDYLQFKQGLITKPELDKRSSQYGSPVLPSQATDPSTAKDWEQVAMQSDPTAQSLMGDKFRETHGVDWQPPTDPPKTPQQQAAQRDVASGVGGGMAQAANNAWWAASAVERAARTFMPFLKDVPSGINPQIQDALRSGGIYVPSGKPFTQQTEPEMKSELLTQSAKLQSQAQTMSGNPQNIGGALLPPGTPSVQQIESQGGKINPQAIAGGTFLTDPTMALMAIPGIDEALGLKSIINPAVAATLKGAGKLSEATGGLSGAIAKGIYNAGDAVGNVSAKYASNIGRSVGEIGGGIAGAFLHMPFGEEGGGGVFLGETLGKHLGWLTGKLGGELVGNVAKLGVNTIGDVPKLLSLAAEPITQGLLTAGRDVADGTSLLSQKGLWPNLIGRGAESFARGSLQMTPYAAATSESPEQFGQTVGTGAALHMAMGGAGIADRAVRNSLFDSAFIRNQGTGIGAGQTLGAKPFNYGTDPVLDQWHASAMSDMGPEHNQIMNDTRQLMRGAAEIYGLKDGDYQQKLLDFQKKGLQNPDLNSQGVAIDPYPGKDQSQVFINTKFFDKAFLHEALGHAIDNTLSPADKQSVFDLAIQNQDPNKFALDYTNRASGGKVSSDYDSLPSQAGQISGQQQWAPGLEGMTKESIQAEMRADAINSLSNGRGIRDLTSDPGITRRAQMALGSFLNKMGIDPTTEDARSIMGFKPSFTTSLLLDQLIRNQFTEKGAKTPLQTPGTTKPPYVPAPPKPTWTGAPAFEPTARSPEVLKDQVTQAFHNNYPNADPNLVQAHLADIQGDNFGDIYKELEKRMKDDLDLEGSGSGSGPPPPPPPPGGGGVPAPEFNNPNIIKPGPVPDMVKEHLTTVGAGGVKFTPEEAEQYVSPNAKTFVGGLKAAIQAKKMATAPTSGTVQGPAVQPAITGAPTSGTVPPAAPSVAPVAPTITEDQKATQVPTTTAVEANPHVQQQLRSEGYDPGTAQQIAKGGQIPERHAGNVGAYGYPGDAFSDTNSLRGIGSFNHSSQPHSLIEDYSAALTKAGAAKRGVLPGQEFMAEDGKTYRYDDTAPDYANGHKVPDNYVDVYSPNHTPDAGVSPEKIARNQQIMAGAGIGYAPEGQRGSLTEGGPRAPLSPGESIVEKSVGGQPPATKSEEPPAAPGPIKREPQPTAPEGTLPDVRRTEESPILPEDISQARENAVASIPAGKKSPQSLADAVTKQVAEQVGTQHAQRLGDGDNRVAYNPETGFFSGQHFVPGDAFHQWLLQGVGDHSKSILGQIEQAISNKTDLHIDYGSAPKGEIGTSTGGTRAEELAASTPQMRAKGETEAQTAGKNVMPSYVGVSLGKKGEPNSVFYGGPSPDKIASNAGQLIQRLGPDSPYKAGPFGDVQAKEDLQGYLHNVTNGWKGDGSAQLEASPNAQVPTPPPDFVPYELAKKNADFWNLSTQGKGAGAQGKPLNKAGEITNSGKARELAEQNKGFQTDEGITNPLHQKIEQETPGWVDKNLHSGWENLRADLTQKIHDNPEEAAAKIHPGHEAVAQALNKEGVPPSRVLKAGFMPGDIVENAKGERERIRAAAVRVGGNIYTGFNHAQAMEEAEKSGEHASEENTGFLTSSGRFISREEAWKLAKDSSQLVNRSDDETLHSEQVQGIRAGDFEKKYGVKLSKDPDKMIHPLSVLLGPRHGK